MPPIRQLVGCLELEVDTSLARRRVTRVFEQMMVERGHKPAIRCDTGRSLLVVIFWRVA